MRARGYYATLRAMRAGPAYPDETGYDAEGYGLSTGLHKRSGARRGDCYIKVMGDDTCDHDLQPVLDECGSLFFRCRSCGFEADHSEMGEAE